MLLPVPIGDEILIVRLPEKGHSARRLTHPPQPQATDTPLLRSLRRALELIVEVEVYPALFDSI